MESICKIMPIASDPAASADLVKEAVEKSRMMQKPCIIWKRACTLLTSRFSLTSGTAG